MNSQFHKSQLLNHNSFKPNKKRLGRDQVQILEESFSTNPKLRTEYKLELAQQLGVSPKQIAIWYQNRRARHKTETKEHEYANIQQELGNVRAEKIRLEKEVCMLKYELKKVQEKLEVATEQPSTNLISGSASDEDISHSFSSGYLPFKWPESGEIPGEEYHACVNYPGNMFDCYLIESVSCNQEAYGDWKMKES